MNWTNALAAMAASVIMYGCGGSNAAPTAEFMPTVVRLDSLLVPGLSPEGAGKILSEQGVGTEVKSLLAEIAGSRANEVFQPDVMERIPSLGEFANDYGLMRQNAATVMPQLQLPDTVFAIVSPYRQSVFFADGKLFIATNHFLGSDYPGYSTFADSEKGVKTPGHMAVSVADAAIRIAAPYDPPEAPSALSAMLHEGAIYAMIEQLMPHLDIANILGFTPADYQWLRDNTTSAWRGIVGANMLFTTDRSLVARLIESPQPVALPDGTVLPPHVGRFIGYLLAKEALSHRVFDDAATLLSPDFKADPSILQQIAPR